MDTNKLWGFILIGVSVVLGLWGLSSLYAAFSYSDQASAIAGAYGGMMGGFGAEMQKAAEAAAPSKLPGFILLILSGVSGFFGTKMLKKSAN